MTRFDLRVAAALLIVAVPTWTSAAPAGAQTTDEPFPDPIPEREGAAVVDFVELAEIPDFEGEPPRMMLLTDEPGTERMFVADMWGILYSLDYDGENVTPYLDLTEPQWGFEVQTASSERGLQSFVFHPRFADEGAPGYGKLYTYVDVVDTDQDPDFTTRHDDTSHHTLLLEWTAEDAEAATYDGGPPREVIRFEQPFRNHNAGHLGFNSTASPGDDDFGLLYVGVADGGSGGDPMDLAQDLGSAFGKIFRIDPLGSGSANEAYGIPGDNPFTNGDDDTLGEIYAYGVRNPQRFDWDPANGNLFLADIGQNIVEELTLVPRGADLGWNDWEGSYGFISRQEVSTENPRGDPDVTYPVAEYGHRDPVLLAPRAAITGVHVYRSDAVPQLQDRVIFGDNPSGEIFHIDADDLPDGGKDALRRVLFNDDGETKTLRQLVQEKAVEQGRDEPDQADLRFGSGPDGQLLLLNKFDGTIRLVVPGGGGSS